MQAAVVGDFVFENTSPPDETIPSINKVGWLQRIAHEPRFSNDEWKEMAEGRPCPTERAYYIRTLDGREFRWTNAQMIALPAGDSLTDWIAATPKGKTP